MNQSWMDDYEPGDVVGNGSFGVIRKVTRKADGAVFARKELHFERMSEKDRKQIVAEVNILKELSHDNIVRYYDRFVDRDRGILYIIMEYCGGGDLGSILNKARKAGRALNEDTVWRYFYQVALALHYCHQSGTDSGDDAHLSGGAKMNQVLHRDIKPENVFLSEHGAVKLGDFGLSKQMGVQLMTHTYVGTPYYMSPEMIEERAYDTKSDIWSLGCLIYELCALRPPFHDAKTHSELASLIKTARIPPLPRGYSASLTTLIKSMLNLNPASRPSTKFLLNHEKLQHMRTVLETENLLVEVRGEKETMHARESAILAREQEVKALAYRVEQERIHLEQEKARTLEDLRTERSRLIEDKKGLEDVKKALHDERRKIEEEKRILQSAVMQLDADRELYDKSARTAREHYAAFEKEREELRREKDTFKREASEFMKERARFKLEAAQMGRPLDDVQNHKSTIPLPIRHSIDEIATSREHFGSRRGASRPQDENQPPAQTSAIPAAPRHNTPSKRASRLASKSNPNLGSAMKGVILTTMGIALETPARGGEHVIPPVPNPSTIPAFQQFLNERMAEDSPESAKLSQSDSEGPRTRVRRRSTISSASHPALQHAATMPTAIPVWNPDNLPPPPVYDMNDEANLPSPFIKKGLNANADAESGRHGPWNTLKAGLKRKGPGLLGIATANSTAAVGKSSSSSTLSSQSSQGTIGKSSRASFAKVVKANEDAQRALQRRAK